MQRVEGNTEFLTEEAFTKFIKTNNEFYENKKKEIHDYYSEREWFSLGFHKMKNHERCEYVLDKNTKFVFVIQNNTLVTCMHLKYIDDESANDLIFSGYIQGIENLQKKIESYEETFSKKKNKHELYIKEADFKIKQLNAKIQEIENNKKAHKSFLEQFEIKKELLNEEIKIAVEKMLVM